MKERSIEPSPTRQSCEIGAERLNEKNVREEGDTIQVSAETSTFTARLISGGRITIPTSVRKHLGMRDGGYVVCSVRAAEKEELPPLKTLWRILQECRRGLPNREIADRCRLSAGASKSYLALLVDEELLTVARAGESEVGEEIYRTTKKGAQLTDLVVRIRGSRR